SLTFFVPYTQSFNSLGQGRNYFDVAAIVQGQLTGASPWHYARTSLGAGLRRTQDSDLRYIWQRLSVDLKQTIKTRAFVDLGAAVEQRIYSERTDNRKDFFFTGQLQPGVGMPN